MLDLVPQRDAMKGKIFTDLKKAGLLKKDFLPYRRGCKTFEKVLGPWRELKAGEAKIPKVAGTKGRLAESISD